MIEIKNRKELDALLNSRDKPKTSNQKTCPKCQQKVYRIFRKGAPIWLGCACSKARIHHSI